MVMMILELILLEISEENILVVNKYTVNSSICVTRDKRIYIYEIKIY